MKRRQFVKGSAIVGLSAIVPGLLIRQSGIITTKSSRKIHRVLSADRTMVGTLPVLRAFAGNHVDYVSPYVFFDEFGPTEVRPVSKPLRVDAHPHAGVTPITYFLNGSGHHKDSLNYDFQIGKGDFMMFVSGRGAIHMEETGQKLYDEGGLYHGFQIWLNLPTKEKFSNPTTAVYKEDKMAFVEGDKFSAKIVMGNWNDHTSSIAFVSPAFYFHVKMQPGCRLEVPVNPSDNAFVYVIKGDVEAEGKSLIRPHQVILYERGGDVIDLFSEGEAELLVLGGKPLNEPVYAYGPFVMNTEAEIMQCIQDYNAGKMGDPAAVNR